MSLELRPNDARLSAGKGPSITAAEFVAIERPPINPYIATADERTILLARNTSLLIGGPSGVAKSLVLMDLCGKLADDHPSRWLGLHVRGGLRVLLSVYDGEGSDEDVQERISQLVPPSALSRLFVWDCWRLGPAPRGDEEGIRALAGEAKRLSIDVVALDTFPAFFSGTYDTRTGIPEQAHHEIEQVRTLAERPLAFAGSVHTRKRDVRAAAKALDELEELAGTFVKKVEGAIVIRREGNDRGPRRRVTFAKVRRGPDIESVIATLPAAPGEAPRLQLVTDLGGAQKKEGTGADEIAAWICEHPQPVHVTHIERRFEISKDTLRRRRDDLAELGIEYDRVTGNQWAYGTAEQWAQHAAENPQPLLQEEA